MLFKAKPAAKVVAKNKLLKPTPNNFSGTEYNSTPQIERRPSFTGPERQRSLTRKCSCGVEANYINATNARLPRRHLTPYLFTDHVAMCGLPCSNSVPQPGQSYRSMLLEPQHDGPNCPVCQTASRVRKAVKHFEKHDTPIHMREDIHVERAVHFGHSFIGLTREEALWIDVTIRSALRYSLGHTIMSHVAVKLSPRLYGYVVDIHIPVQAIQYYEIEE